jgi:hypothetical protein
MTVTQRRSSSRIKKIDLTKRDYYWAPIFVHLLASSRDSKTNNLSRAIRSAASSMKSGAHCAVEPINGTAIIPSTKSRRGCHSSAKLRVWCGYLIERLYLCNMDASNVIHFARVLFARDDVRCMAEIVGERHGNTLSRHCGDRLERPGGDGNSSRLSVLSGRMDGRVL